MTQLVHLAWVAKTNIHHIACDVIRYDYAHEGYVSTSTPTCLACISYVSKKPVMWRMYKAWTHHG